MPNMTVYGHSKVDVENKDNELCWYVYEPKTDRVLVKLSYRHMFDISEIKHSRDLLHALSACLCFLGVPSDESLDRLFLKYPNLPRSPHAICRKVMKESSWANEKSKLLLKISELEKKVETQKQKQKQKKKKKKKKPPQEEPSVFEDAILESGNKKRKLNL